MREKRASSYEKRAEKPFYIGKIKYLESGAEIKGAYKEIAKQNEKAADILCEQGCHNEAAYLYIQAMEKYTKAKICEKVNITLPYFSERLREIGHSVDKSIDFLIEIYAGGNEMMKNHITTLINETILHSIRFGLLHNRLRYPETNRSGEYIFLSAGATDCAELKKMLTNLIKCLNDIDKL